ncbi:hypothetical protein [Accumulibacter sp.]|uniref:hypothetical protein n=1 Tax=Accumulibacter sp. TaxID=2053492 RepID=UPI00391894E4
MLLVEDDPMIGKSVEQGRRQDGYTVDRVRDGQPAETGSATTAYGYQKDQGELTTEITPTLLIVLDHRKIKLCLLGVAGAPAFWPRCLL